MNEPRAIFFDFNGTLSDDEGVLFRIYSQLFGEWGRPLSQEQYTDELAGHGDQEMFRRWLGEREGFERFFAERIDRYIAGADGSTISEAARAAVCYAAERVPVAAVSGASTGEVDAVLRAAGIRDCFFTIVGVDRVERTKPEPDSYLLALSELRERIGPVTAAEVVTIEDTPPGIEAAKAAGLRCLAIIGTTPPERLAAADELIDVIDRPLIERLLGS